MLVSATLIIFIILAATATGGNMEVEETKQTVKYSDGTSMSYASCEFKSLGDVGALWFFSYAIWNWMWFFSSCVLLFFTAGSVAQAPAGAEETTTRPLPRAAGRGDAAAGTRIFL